jgi:hypothetical protein
LDKLSSSIKNQDHLVHAYNALDSATDKGADCIDVKCCEKLATSLASNSSLDKPASCSKLETGQSSEALEISSHVIGHSGKELTNDSPQEKPARANHVAEPTHLDVEPATESGLRT